MNIALKSPQDKGDQTRADIDSGAERPGTLQMLTKSHSEHFQSPKILVLCAQHPRHLHTLWWELLCLGGNKLLLCGWQCNTCCSCFWYLITERVSIPSYCLCCFGRLYFKQFFPFWLLQCTPLPEEF